MQLLMVWIDCVCVCGESTELRVIKWAIAQPRNPAAHWANGRPGPLLLRPMGSPLAQWARPWAIFYAHGHPVG